MGKICVTENVTLDGVIQSPAAPDEDTSGGFKHGGWAAGYADEVTGKVMAEEMSKGRPLLLGRKTYQHFFSFWPKQTDGNPFTDVLNQREKYVVSNTLKEPLPWENSTLLDGDGAAQVAKLKASLDDDIVVLGSGELVKSLAQHDLVDEWLLSIHPVVVGSGKRLFADDATFAKLRLVNSTPTTTGVLIATYVPAVAQRRRV